jgi:hypothetical protein
LIDAWFAGTVAESNCNAPPLAAGNGKCSWS